MAEKFDLNKMMEEIAADEYAGDPKSLKVSQDAIKRLISGKKRMNPEKAEDRDKES